MSVQQQQQQQQQPTDPEAQHKPFRVRTVTAFLQLPSDSSRWEAEVAAAGRFLAFAQQQLEARGYEVQTVRIATQPFPDFLTAATTTQPNSNSSSAHSQSHNPHHNPQQRQQQQQHHDVMVTNAVLLEALAAQHGIPLVSLGSSSDPQHLGVIPRIITATHSTSCTFALPPEPDWGLAHRVAEVIMDIAGATGGMGNFRFGSASNMRPGIPYFPVACCGGPQQHSSFAIGTEADALLHQAFSAAAAAAAAAGGGRGAGQQRVNVLQLAAQQLHDLLLEHFAPLEAAALDIQGMFAAQQGCPASSTPADTAANSSSSSGGSGTHETFSYLGLDTSLAPSLDTPPLTDSYQLLLQQLQPAGTDQAVEGPGFGGPGSLTVSSMITQVLKQLPLKLTGYCGLMLAVCEDQGLAAAAAAGSITISQLLQYSAVCGCGLDTVPVPGPAKAQQQQQQQEYVVPGAAEPDGLSPPAAAAEQSAGSLAGQDQGKLRGSGAAAAAQQDADTTAAIAGLVADVNTLAHRLNKPLACRLLPLPGQSAGEATGFNHPYMINSRVMDLHK